MFFTFPGAGLRTPGLGAAPRRVWRSGGAAVASSRSPAGTQSVSLSSREKE